MSLSAAVQAQDAPKADESEEFTTRIFVSNIDGTEMKPLTDLPEIQAQGSPAWSQDGSMIAFDGWRPQKREVRRAHARHAPAMKSRRDANRASR
ncbi:MAG: hypothetical protein IT428_04155 [Planctomycetaceae bacterium]|nr:hypothetical protein [Planctomycetaceae bacterium]